MNVVVPDFEVVERPKSVDRRKWGGIVNALRSLEADKALLIHCESRVDVDRYRNGINSCLARSGQRVAMRYDRANKKLYAFIEPSRSKKNGASRLVSV